MTPEQVAAAAAKLREAQSCIAKAQDLLVDGSAAWHRMESADDRIHEALTALGD